MVPQPNQRRHYCRQCGALFTVDETKPEALRVSPHAQSMVHWLTYHDDNRSENKFKSCSRYCSDAEQPEEQRAGKRLYGNPRPEGLPDVLVSYEKLFPEEKC